MGDNGKDLIMVSVLDSGLSGLLLSNAAAGVVLMNRKLSAYLTYFDFPAKTKAKNSWLIKVQKTKAFVVITPAMVEQILYISFLEKTLKDFWKGGKYITWLTTDSLFIKTYIKRICFICLGWVWKSFFAFNDWNSQTGSFNDLFK